MTTFDTTPEGKDQKRRAIDGLIAGAMVGATMVGGIGAIEGGVSDAVARSIVGGLLGALGGITGGLAIRSSSFIGGAVGAVILLFALFCLSNAHLQ